MQVGVEMGRWMDGGGVVVYEWWWWVVYGVGMREREGGVLVYICIGIRVHCRWTAVHFEHARRGGTNLRRRKVGMPQERHGTERRSEPPIHVAAADASG